MGFSDDQWILGVALVGSGIGNDQDLVGLGNSLGTEGIGPGCFPHGKPMIGLEPLPLGINQANEGNGSLTDLGGQLGQLIILRFGQGIQDVVGS